MPNSIHDTEDGQRQLSALTTMRALLRHFTDRNLRNEPFILMLTDLHQSNLFVDSDWHITAIIDLEWASILPIEMQHPPYWLTGLSIDKLLGKDLEAFTSVHAEFMAIFEKEERSFTKDGIVHTQIMRKG
jgi:Phosphotransferase enzyme family